LSGENTTHGSSASSQKAPCTGNNLRLIVFHKLALVVVALDIFTWSVKRWEIAAFSIYNLVASTIILSLLIAGWIKKKRSAGIYTLNGVSGALILAFALFLIYPVEGAIVIPIFSVLIFGSVVWIDLDKSGSARLDVFHKLALTALAVQATILISGLPKAIPPISQNLVWRISWICLCIFIASMLLGWLKVKTLKKTRTVRYVPTVFAVFFAIFLLYPKHFYITLPIVILLMLTRKFWVIPEEKPLGPDIK